jgi:hypothetical protein
MRLSKLTFILSIIFAFSFLGCKKPEVPKISKAISQVKTTPKQSEQQEAESLLRELRQKNPFCLDHATGLVIEAAGGTGLKGIFWDSQKPFAIIGDSVVREGDDIEGKKVIKIDKDSVVLEDESGQTVLRLEGISE